MTEAERTVMVKTNGKICDDNYLNGCRYFRDCWDKVVVQFKYPDGEVRTQVIPGGGCPLAKPLTTGVDGGKV